MATFHGNSILRASLFASLETVDTSMLTIVLGGVDHEQSRIFAEVSV